MKQAAIRTTLALGCLLALTAAVAVAGDAAETVTLEGNIMCAKCALGTADDCQNILVVEVEKDADPVHYYIVDNEVADKFGHPCEGAKGVVATGTVEKREGKMWLTASKMVPPKEA
jgi:hypothetical protein